MQRRYVLSILAALPVAGCARISGSGLNPFNWFGSARRSRRGNRTEKTPLVDPSRIGAAAETRPLIAQIESMQIDRIPGGAIVTATGIAEGAGYYDAVLLPAGNENGVLTYDFHAQNPAVPVAGPTVSSRRITVAVTLTNTELAGIRTITVRGALNVASSSR
jgi:hypothetical protein